MSVHPSGHSTAHGPERDALARDIHATVSGLALPPSGIDLGRVHRRGQRRRTARRVLIATPVLALVLASGAALVHPWQSDPITAAKPQVTSTLQGTEATAAAAAAFYDALQAMDPDLNWDTNVGLAESGETGQQVGWATSYWDTRSNPRAQLVLSVSTLAQGPDAYAAATGCFVPSQCTTDQLDAGAQLVTVTSPMSSTAGDGTTVEGSHSQVSAVYPDGRIVSAYTLLTPANQAGLGAAGSFDSPLITKDDLRVLVTTPALAEVALPAP